MLYIIPLRTRTCFKVYIHVCVSLTEGQEVKVGEYNAIADVLDLINNSIRFQGIKKESRHVCICLYLCVCVCVEALTQGCRHLHRWKRCLDASDVCLYPQYVFMYTIQYVKEVVTQHLSSRVHLLTRTQTPSSTQKSSDILRRHSHHSVYRLTAVLYHSKLSSLN